MLRQQQHHCFRFVHSQLRTWNKNRVLSVVDEATRATTYYSPPTTRFLVGRTTSTPTRRTFSVLLRRRWTSTPTSTVKTVTTTTTTTTATTPSMRVSISTIGIIFSTITTSQSPFSLLRQFPYQCQCHALHQMVPPTATKLSSIVLDNSWPRELSPETAENLQRSRDWEDIPDTDDNRRKRPVFNGHFVLVPPTGLRQPQMVLVSNDVATNLLGLTPQQVESDDFLQWVSGNLILGETWATPYALSIMGTRYTRYVRPCHGRVFLLRPSTSGLNGVDVVFLFLFISVGGLDDDTTTVATVHMGLAMGMVMDVL